jgi:DNA polymerase
MNENLRTELRELIIATKEHLAFIEELGVEHAETTKLPEVPPLPVSVAQQSVTQIKEQPRAEGLFGDLAPSAPGLPQSNETFEEIWASVGNCVRCPLHQQRTNIVHTEGNRKARLMFVGEAPGADEDLQSRPFVGRAGQLLTKIIEAIGFKREEVLIGNVNRCRPPGNRAPTTEEAEMCKPFLLREIATVRPDVIVVLGNTAMKNLLDTKEGITKVRGKFQDYKGIKVMPTFHPAYLLRDPSKKRETWEDLKKVRDYLDELNRT